MRSLTQLSRAGDGLSTRLDPSLTCTDMCQYCNLATHADLLAHSRESLISPCTRACVYAYVYVHESMCICIRVYTYVYVHESMCICIRVCAREHMYMHTCIYIRVCAREHVYIHTCMCTMIITGDGLSTYRARFSLLCTEYMHKYCRGWGSAYSMPYSCRGSSALYKVKVIKWFDCTAIH